MPKTVWLFVSVAVNFFLLVVLIRIAVLDRALSPEMRTHSAAPVAISSAPGATVVAPVSTAPPPQAGPEPPALREADWQLAEDGDYGTYLDNLRELNIPDGIAADIIVARVNADYRNRIETLRPEESGRAFWKSGHAILGGAMADEEQLLQVQALNRERLDLLRGLLGDDYMDPPGYAALQPVNLLRTRLPEILSGKRITEVNEIEDRFSARLLRLYRLGRGPEERIALRRDMEAELAAVMTPEEKRQYDLRQSPTAHMLRYRMFGFEPTEAEFRKVFDLQWAFDLQWPLETRHQTRDSEEFQAARQALDDQILGALGQQRFDDFQRAADPVFRSLYRFGARSGQDSLAVESVYDAYLVARDSARQLDHQGDQGGDQGEQAEPGDRENSQALEILRNDLRKAIAETFGIDPGEVDTNPDLGVLLDLGEDRVR